MAGKKQAETAVLPVDFARQFDIPSAQVYRAVKAGFFASVSWTDPATKKVWLYPLAAKKHWDANRDHTKTDNLKRAAKATNDKLGTKRERSATKPPAAATQASHPAETIGESIAEIKRKSAQIKLQSDALDLQRKRGSLVDKGKVYSALFEVGKELRLAFQSIPDRVVDAMLAAGNRAEAHALLAKEIQQQLERMADAIGRDLIPPEQ